MNKNILKYMILLILLVNNLYSQTTIEYLNQKRIDAGMTPFASNSLLNQSAQNHADYISTNIYNIEFEGHDETAGNDGFTGVEPWDRAYHVGYKFNTGENLTVGYDDYNKSIDGLFTAIYHRFGFLDFYFNEIGFGESINSENGDLYSHVYNMGNIEFNNLCANNYTGNDSYYEGVCMDENTKIEASLLEQAIYQIEHSNPSIIIWPYENQTDFQTAFSEESPDPLPNCSITGNPISLQFNPSNISTINMESFKLFNFKNTEITDTTILTQATDPNGMFTGHDFAMFPMKRLDFNSNYKAIFKYSENGISRTKAWFFSTQKLEHDYFEITETNTTIKAISGNTYFIYVAPAHCNDARFEFSYEHTTANEPVMEIMDESILEVTLTGNIGEYLELVLANGKTIKVEIAEEDDAISSNTQNNLPTLTNGAYNPTEDTYYSLVMPEDGNIDIDFESIYKHKVTIYDLNMNIVKQTINSNTTFSLDADNYIVKISNDGGVNNPVSVYIPILDTNPQILSNGNYNPTITSYYSLTIPESANIDIDFVSYDNHKVVIYDSNMDNVIFTIDNANTINLDAGNYIVKIDGKGDKPIFIYSPFLDSNPNYPTLTNGNYNPTITTLYTLIMPESGNIDVDLSNYKQQAVTIYDSTMKLIKSTINYKKTNNLDAGTYIVKINGEGGISEYATIYSPILDTNNNLSSLSNGNYNPLLTTYYYFNMPENGNIDISDGSIVIYDLNMQIVNSVLANNTINLNAGSYIVKLYGYTTIYSPVLNTIKNLPLLTSGNYLPSTTTFYSLEIPNYTNMDIDYRSVNSHNVTIFDSNLNIVIPKITNNKSITLLEGDYLIKINGNGGSNYVSIFIDTLPILTNKNYAPSTTINYSFVMPEDGDINFNFSDTFSHTLTIYDINMQIVRDSIYSSRTISLNAGTFIIKMEIFWDWSIEDTIIIYSSALEIYSDNDNDGIPNGYEDANDLNSSFDDSLLDLDGDGISNIQEYLDNTRANDINSKMVTLELNEGWNLVSLALIGEINLSELNSDITTVRSYQNDKWHVWTNDNTTSTEEPLSKLQAGFGYWIKASQYTTMEFKGDGLYQAQSLANIAEWKMLGSQEIQDITTFLSENTNITSVWVYRDTWQSITNDEVINATLNDSNVTEVFSIESHEGFMVK